MEDPKRIGRVGFRIVVFFLVTTIIGGGIGLLLGNVFRPGSGVQMRPPEGFEYKQPEQKITDVLVNIIPKNPVEAFAKMDLLAILFVVLFFGVVLASLGKKTETLQKVFAEWTDVSLKMLEAIMQLAPYGAGALIAFSIGIYGPRVLGPLGKLVLVVWLGQLLILIEYALIMLVNGVSPIKFLRTVSEPAMVAMSTCSSMAALASNVRATKKMGVPHAIATFGITLGNVVHMDGTALYQALAVLFVAQTYGLQVPAAGQIMTVVMAALVTISLVGIPGAGSATLGILLMAVGLPVEGVGLVLAVDRLCDMPRTMNNIIGDAVCTLLAAKSEGMLEKAQETVMIGDKTVAGI